MITVLFSCPKCGATKRPARVRNRRPDEDVVFWVEHVAMLAVTYEHGRASLLCEGPACDLMIPLPPCGWRIGDEADTPEFREARARQALLVRD